MTGEGEAQLGLQLAQALQQIQKLQQENHDLRKELLELKANDGRPGLKKAKSSTEMAAKQSPSTSTTAASPDKDDDGTVHFSFAPNKRVSVSLFKGMLLIGIREWYRRDGKLSPGKGISLSAAAFNALVSGVEAAEKAFASDDAGDFELSLEKSARGNEKLLSISVFKGKKYYNVREYFTTNDGERRPTKKGTTMDGALWSTFVELIPSIQAAMSEVGGE